jgi:hypothetical protein
VALCAHNCAFRNNPRAYALALSRLLVNNGCGQLLDAHTKLLPGAELTQSASAHGAAARSSSHMTR